MSNSSLVTYTLISPNRTHHRNNKIDTITIHCVVGQWTVEQGCKYFAQSHVEASCNYFVAKDGKIGQCVSEDDRSWTTGGNIEVNGITGKMNDHRAVTIEVASDTTTPYAVTDAAYNALIRLVADIAKRNNIGELKWKADKSLVGKPDQQNMTVHRWFANKACPGDYLYERMGDIAEKANAINKEENEVTEEQVQEMINNAVSDLKPTVYKTLADVPDWALPTIESLVKNGRLKGDGNGNLNLTEDLTRALVIMSR